MKAKMKITKFSKSDVDVLSHYLKNQNVIVVDPKFTKEFIDERKDVQFMTAMMWARNNNVILISSDFMKKHFHNYEQGCSTYSYFKKQAELKGGIKEYSVDIDLEDGEQVRGSEVEFKSYDKALKLFNQVKSSMEYDGDAVDDIQLIVNYGNGDYDTIGGNK